VRSKLVNDVLFLIVSAIAVVPLNDTLHSSAEHSLRFTKQQLKRGHVRMIRLMSVLFSLKAAASIVAPADLISFSAKIYPHKHCHLATKEQPVPATAVTCWF
jgi:hypothetical protein